jgi:thymidylate synthase ThyX
MIEAKVIADSISPQGDRLTTFILTFPRIILAEFNTHRMFSRNSASSRAIPFEKMVKSVQENPFIPIAWQKEHKGMQGTEYITDENNISDCINDWLEARNNAIRIATRLNSGFWIEEETKVGEDRVTKQLCNRLLEPFMWHTVIITSGKEGLENFFNLRDHEAAEIHIQELARKMKEVYNESKPKQLQAGKWHIPFGDNINTFDFTNFKMKLWENKQAPTNGHNDLIVKISTARCARVSYTVVGEEGKEPNYENDIKLHDRLLESGHFSPFEHCAKVMSDEEYESFIKGEVDFGFDIPKHTMGWCNNFKGFIPYRYLIEKK